MGGLGRWRDRVKGRLGHARRRAADPDNGPAGSGSRPPFLRRTAAFAGATGWVVRLAYDPPPHRTYDPAGRCRAALERKWRGGRRTSPGGILGYARGVTWPGEAPSADTPSDEDPGGVERTKAEVRPSEARLERPKALPRYNIVIRPRARNGG